MKSEYSIDAHGRNQVLGLLIYQNTLFTIGLDSFLIAWDCSEVFIKQKRKIQIVSPYLHCFSLLKTKQLSLGLANGTILFINIQTLNIQNRVKHHSDLPTSIIQLQNIYISSSIDSTIVTYKNDTFQVLQKINIGQPIWKIIMAQEKIFVLGDNHIHVTKCSKNVLEPVDFVNTPFKFKGCQIYRDMLYCFNDQNIFVVSQQENVSDVGCDLLVSVQSCILLCFREEKVGVLCCQNKEQNVKKQFRWARVAELKQGYDLRCAAFKNNLVYVAGDQGKVHIFNIQKIKQMVKY